MQSPGLSTVWADVDMPAGGEARERIEVPDPVELVLERPRSAGRIHAVAYRSGEVITAARAPSGNELRFGSGGPLSFPLGPGEYRIVVGGEDVPQIEREVVLRAGEPQRIVIPVPEARKVVIAVLVEGGEGTSTLELETLAGDGRVLARMPWSLRHQAPFAVRKEATRVRVLAAGLRGEAELPDGDGAVEVVLRPDR